MSNEVVERLQKYCREHQELINSGILKGIDSVTSEIVLEKNGTQKRVSIDILENNMFDFDNFNMKSNNEDDGIETLEELIVDEPKSIEIPKTISELNEAIKNKDEKVIDKALETFAINEKTGVVDMNTAIGIVTNNAVKEAVDCIINNKEFDSDMSKYDVSGRKVVEDEE